MHISCATRALTLLPALLVHRRASTEISCVCRGDVVQIIDDVMVKGKNTNGMVGDVFEDLAENDAEEWGACCELAYGQASLRVRLRPTLNGYFEPEELSKLHGSSGIEIVEGDRVQVVQDVQVRGGRNSKGWEGTVTDVWTDCETDPCCCCNELATAPITVRLEMVVDDDDAVDADTQPQPLVGLFDPEEVRVMR